MNCFFVFCVSSLRRWRKLWQPSQPWEDSWGNLTHRQWIVHSLKAACITADSRLVVVAHPRGCRISPHLYCMVPNFWGTQFLWFCGNSFHGSRCISFCFSSLEDFERVNCVKMTSRIQRSSTRWWCAGIVVRHLRIKLCINGRDHRLHSLLQSSFVDGWGNFSSVLACLSK